MAQKFRGALHHKPGLASRIPDTFTKPDDFIDTMLKFKQQKIVLFFDEANALLQVPEPVKSSFLGTLRSLKDHPSLPVQVCVIIILNCAVSLP